MRRRTPIPALLIALFLLPPTVWAAGATMVGRWSITGNHSTKGKYAGWMVITRVSGSNYSVTGERAYGDGTKDAISGNAVFSRNFWDWFSRKGTFTIKYSLPGAGILDRMGGANTTASIKATYRVAKDQKSMTGEWRCVQAPHFNGKETLLRRDDLVVTGIEPKSLEQGTEDRDVKVSGANFPAGLKPADVTVPAPGGVTIGRILEVADDGTSFKAKISVAKDAAPGARSLKVADTVGKDLLTVEAATVRLKLGGSATATAGQWFKLFVPEPKGGELSLTGTAVELRQGTKEGKVVAAAESGKYSIPEDAAGWYFLKAAAAGELTSRFAQQAEVPAAKKPWNFWYFPFYERGRDMNLYCENGGYEKIDKVLGLKHPADGYSAFDKGRHMDSDFVEPTTDEEKAKYDESTTRGFAYCYARSTDSKKSWWGHCWGAVVASSIYAQPAEATVKDAAGQDVTFSQEEVEGLLSSFMTNNSVRPVNYMRGCPPGRPTDALKEEVDGYADDYFLGLQEGIKKNGLPLASNLRAASTSDDAKDQVWNHVVWKYEATYREVEGKDDPTYVEVSCDVTATEDVFPSGETAHRDETFVWRFKYDEAGALQRDAGDAQNWVSASHFCPSYLWRINAANSGGTENEVLEKYLSKLEQLFKLKKIN